MKNKMSDLHNHLFAQLERLGDEDLKGDELKEEVGRASAIAKISHQIISNVDLALKAERMMEENLIANKPEVLLESKRCQLKSIRKK